MRSEGRIVVPCTVAGIPAVGAMDIGPLASPKKLVLSSFDLPKGIDRFFF